MTSIKKLKEVQPVTEEIQKAFDNLFSKMSDTSYLNGYIGKFDELSRLCGTTDETFAAFLETTQKSGTVYEDATEALEAYKEYLKSSGDNAALANLKTKALSASMKALSYIGWMALISGVTWVISKGVEAIDNYIHRVEKANEAMDDAVSEYESAKSSLENISTELEEQSKRIDELNSKDKLTYAEKGELEELQAITRELALQEDIEKRRADRASKDAADAAVKAFDTQYGDYNNSEENLKYLLSLDRTVVASDYENDVIGIIAELEKTKEALVQVEADYKQALADGEDTTYLADDMQWYIDGIADYEDILDAAISSLSDKQIALQEEYNKAIEKRNDGTIPLTSNETEYIETYEQISDLIKLIYKYTDANTWNSLEIADIFNTSGIEKTKEELIAMAKEGELSPKVIESYSNLNNAISNSEIFLKSGQTAAEAFCDELYAIAEAEEQVGDTTTSDKTSISYESLAESAEEATDTVSTLRNSISDLNDAFAEQAENGSISVDTMLKLVEAGYATALQFDETTGACIINKDAMLDLVKAKIENQIADLESLQTDIASKLKEDGLIASESAKGFLALAEAKKAAATAEQLASVQDYNEAAAQIKALKNSLQNIDKISSGTYSSKAPSSSASSSKSSSDPYKEAFTKEYNTLKHNLEMEYITEKQYYDSLSELNNKYFAGKSQYLDEYRQYEEEVYKGLQSYYKDYVESSMDLLEKQLDVGVINYQHYSSTVKSLLDNMYSDEKISAEDYFSYVETMLNKQLDIYKAALSGVTSLLDSEIDKWEEKIDALNEQNDLLEKQKDDYDAILSAVDDVYQSEIDKLEEQKDLLQDKIDAINDANDALDLQKRKQEALYALERAKNQRTIKLYADGQYIYTQDYDEIREAQDNLKDIENEEIIKKLEEEQDALDKSIELLESYRELWGQISDAYDQEINKQLAVALWGENYESLILQNRISDIESFKSNYISIQEQINDNTSLIESYEQKVEYYSRLKDQWNSISDEYENNMNRQYAAQLLGANWEVDVLSGRLDVLNNFRNQYVALQQAIADTAWNSANSQIAAYNAVKEAEVTKAQTSGGTSGNVGSSSTSSNVTNTVDKPKVSTSGASGGKNFNQAILRYGTGTDNAKKGLNLVGEDGAEVYIDNDDNASIVTEPTLIPMEGGETVIKSSETEKILKSIRKLIPLENIVLGKSEATLPFDLEDFSKRLQSFAPSYSSMFHMPNMQISNLDFVPAQDRTTPVVQHVTLTLPNVTNNSGYERIKKELYQMQIDAYQFAHRR